MSKRINRIIPLGAFVLVFVFILASPTRAETLAPEAARLKTLLDCTCQCGLNLAFCEKEDADCSVRPALMAKLDRLLEEGKREMELVRAFTGPLHPIRERLMEARLQGHYTILFFYQEGCEKCEDVKPVLEEASDILGDKANILRVDINKAENSKILEEFRIYSSPVVLVIAPNGVVTREFKEDVTFESLQSAFVTPAMAEILRGLQDRRVIFLTVYAADWKNAPSVRKTVSDAGQILRTSTRSVHVDPESTEEKPLLNVLKVEKNQNQSLTYVVSQSGQIGSRFEGPVSRKDLFMAFQKVLSARSGCGGSGSGPGGNTCK